MANKPMTKDEWLGWIKQTWDAAQKAAWAEKPPQREWVGLTDEEINEIIGPWGETPIRGYTRRLFDQIEAKLKEKNR
jgi:hypothetical protein